MKLIDLHVHSNMSDGTLSPSDLALYAKAKGLSVIALTDHDTISGIEACMLQGLDIGLTVIPGIEFSAEYNSQEIHILGYYIDHKDIFFQKRLEAIIDNRIKRNAMMLERLSALGFPLTEKDLNTSGSEKAVLTRAHFAAALYKKGYIKTIGEAFEKYIGHGKPAYVPRIRLTPEYCIESIHQAGGLAVLAHPCLYGYDGAAKEVLVKHLADIGLDGIETLYSTHTQEEVTELLNLSLKYKLFPTGGSDFHGVQIQHL